MSISPAPWRTEGYKNLIVNDANGNTIAAYPGCGGVEAGQANARLIAAAPRLLEFAKAFLEFWAGPGETDSPLEMMAREAIESAELPQENSTT